MSELAKVAAAALFIMALSGLGVWWAWRNYAECRAHGFSRIYCLSAHQ